ncbi:MAG: hypothetical protein JXR48_08330 [Candidatus Delongbacteria bacterium]|nr:hypothetical protein [Candidatus Delongbacteria bacterium]MBN2834961.1 hypothetical protein [Candidatus Delongbacteria bacterium]
MFFKLVFISFFYSILLSNNTDMTNYTSIQKCEDKIILIGENRNRNITVKINTNSDIHSIEIKKNDNEISLNEPDAKILDHYIYLTYVSYKEDRSFYFNIIKLDLSGNIVWKKRIDNFHNITCGNMIIDNNSLIIPIEYQSSANKRNQSILKLDHDGNILLTQEVIFDKVFNKIKSIVKLNENRFVVCTFHEDTTDTYSRYIGFSYLDSNMQMIKKKYYSSKGLEYKSALVVNNDIYYAGRFNYGVENGYSIAKLDSNLDTLWTKNYYYSDSNYDTRDRCVAIHQYDSFIYILGADNCRWGSIGQNLESCSLNLQKFDLNGSLLSINELVSDIPMFGIEFIKIEDFFYIIGFKDNDPESINPYEGFLLKIRENELKSKPKKFVEKKIRGLSIKNS